MPLIFEIRKDLRGMDRISHYYFFIVGFLSHLAFLFYPGSTLCIQFDSVKREESDQQKEF